MRTDTEATLAQNSTMSNTIHHKVEPTYIVQLSMDIYSKIKIISQKADKLCNNYINKNIESPNLIDTM